MSFNNLGEQLSSVWPKCKFWNEAKEVAHLMSEYRVPIINRILASSQESADTFRL
ncbi:MAG: hypothetical protein UZ20_WS6002000552 [candidate division WS6 bacterium OLB21]|uniref:Uncharacterized protein n=1 Tax=candidate division WS6 bacterium OLB21 TaxID=1617427 RepID=A0A136KJA4_9BACT|nr:MAG: hypothetical protein UZ20_WS6002000552 [candidate division WS6 bacterium OLB21]